MLAPARREPFAELYPVPIARTDQKGDPMSNAATQRAATPNKHPAEDLAREIADSVRTVLANGIVLAATLQDGHVEMAFFSGPTAQVAEQVSAALNVTVEWVRAVLSAQRADALPLFVRLDADDLVFPFDARDPIRIAPASKQTQKTKVERRTP